MIIDKVQPYWTEEELQQLQKYDEQQEHILDSLDYLTTDEEGGLLLKPAKAPKKSGTDFLTEWQEIAKKQRALRSEVENRYIKSFSHTKEKGILADIKEIVNAVDREDFIATIKVQLGQLAYMKNEGLPDEDLTALKEYAIENYTNCYEFILNKLRVQFNALAYYKIDTYKAEAIIDKRVSLWYVKPQPDFLPLAHGKATDDLAFMSSKRAKIDQITKDAVIEKLGTQLVISKLEELQASWGVSTDKLFSKTLATFTKSNDFSHLNGKEPERRITIGLREYAQSLGYDVEEHATNTPAEAEKEKKRAKNQLDNVRKAVKKDLDIIHASTLTWEEPIKGKVKDFARVSLVTYTGIRNGEIQISLSPEIAGYLAEHNLITQYPTKLLRLDSRKPTAYYIGRKLAEYYNMDSNQIRGTQDRISIKKLLEVTDLPTYEEVQKKDRGHWVNRIKEPFEEALDALTKDHILNSWEYTHAKGVPLTDEEAENITNYKDFESLYLLFDPADKVDHEERIEAKQEERARRAQRKRAHKSTAKKPESEEGI